jgi:peptidoglycan/xylan/chitin deacetylase (PgdA/CDA1 family)
MRCGRRLRAFLLITALAGLGLVAPITASAQGQTVVSLTFDDGWADNYQTRSTLAAHGMKGTYYVNTGRTGTSGWMSWNQLVTLDADGHEIAGHTLDHVDLVAATEAEARRQVCDDRQNLLSRGFVAPSFAYPFGEYNATAKSIVQECGYASGRGAFGLRNITSTTDTRPLAVPIPPPDLYAILTPCCIRSDVTLEHLQNYIVQAENNGGGWVPLVLHRICENCGGDSPAPSMTPATFQAFVDWLAQRVSRGTVVRTVGQVVSGDAQPATSSAQCNSSMCSSGSYVGPVSVSLQATDGGSGVAAVRYTLDGSEPTVSSPLYTGPFTVSQTTTVKFRSWDDAGNVEPVRSQPIQIDATAPPQDTIAPTSAIACDGSACSAGWYTAPASVTLSATDDASEVAAIRYTLDGSEPTAASPLYTGPFMVSQTATVRYRAWDNAGNVEAANSQLVRIDAAAPTVVITAPADGATVKGVVKVTTTAGDVGSGVLRVSFYANGVLIGSKTGSGTVSVNWNTSKLKGQYTLTAVAEDVAGNSRTSAPVTVTVR